MEKVLILSTDEPTDEAPRVWGAGAGVGEAGGEELAAVHTDFAPFSRQNEKYPENASSKFSSSTPGDQILSIISEGAGGELDK